VGKLYEIVREIDRVIHERDLPIFMTKGRISIQSGFPLGMVRKDTPDDAQKLEKLLAAARSVLGDDFTGWAA